ncbi:hypothetical protein Egran_04548 [Elaphomyces granulatus]|uniref:DASH complex subunit SPC34 n=1 Tax=Elaphomyces granulatus TaxID=519963 RepID=A0A232LUI7_9EURO|nr:hypothetical protein Egran_04548 [Elaphomyces granulatus]
MTLLESHLEQITLSANAISELPFPPPKIFTNALLNAPDITTLIRDTEAHERALFSIDPSAKPLKPAPRRATRRTTIFPAEPETESLADRLASVRGRRPPSVVARVLGGDMLEEIKRSVGASASALRGEINVEVLLRGAEMLCHVYPITGAAEKISTLRYRYQEVSDSIAQLEARVAKNAAQLDRLNRSYGDPDDDREPFEIRQPDTVDITDEDIERELDEIHELEQKKRVLEDRVTGLERDLGGLRR